MLQSFENYFTESPIENFRFLDKNPKKKNAFDDKSLKLLRNKAMESRILSAWKTDHKFNIVVLKSPEASKWMEHGEVDENFVRETLKYPEFVKDNSSTNIIFTNNTGAERVPLTPWVMAHRVGHVLYRSRSTDMTMEEFWNYVLREIDTSFGYIGNEYGIWNIGHFRYFADFGRSNDVSAGKVSKVCNAIGSMRSARSGKITRPFEFIFETFAQSLVAGNITLDNRPIKYGRTTYTYDRAHYDVLDQFTEFLNYAYNHIVSKSAGKIYVM